MTAIATATPEPLGPFLKWAGGKSSLIPQLAPLFPLHYGRYHEPFLGGGSVFLHVAPRSALLSDINSRLMDCYKAIRDEVETVIAHLSRLKTSHSDDSYYAARDRLNQCAELPRARRAALQVYLNKTCYNGLYRENQSGHFNVPVGRYSNPSIFASEHLHAVSHRLRCAQLDCLPFESVLDRAQPGDFVYFDPPYAPISKTSNFTSFTRFGFSPFDQSRLAEVCRELDRRGCFFLQSNSNASLIRRLYHRYRVANISARRRINSKASRRGAITELAIYNYDPLDR